MLRRTIDVIITIVDLTGNPLIGEATTMTTAKTKSASQECPTVPTDAFKRYIECSHKRRHSRSIRSRYRGLEELFVGRVRCATTR